MGKWNIVVHQPPDYLIRPQEAKLLEPEVAEEEAEPLGEPLAEPLASSSGRHDEVDWGFVPLGKGPKPRAFAQEADRGLLRAWLGEEEGRAG